MRQVDWLVVHTCGAFDWVHRKVVHQSVEVVRRYHIDVKGWHDIGYHKYIEHDGTCRLGRLPQEVGAGVEGFNDHTLHICCSGDGDHEPFNLAQLQSLTYELAAWARQFHLAFDRAIGHRETQLHGGPVVYKDCPGRFVDLSQIRDRLRAELAGVASV